MSILLVQSNQTVIYTEKKVNLFPPHGGMLQTKLYLAENNLIIPRQGILV
jgi:hypothetical protein